MRTRSYFEYFLKSLLSITLGIGVLVFSPDSNAVPSFARQTGMNCMACHTVFPKLTSFGRLFKLNGYTTTGLQQIESKPSSTTPGLQVNAIAPMSAMLQAALTHHQSVDANTENNGVTFPAALSLYYAGEITDHAGAFVQVTMDNAESSFGFDMADVRYANTTSIGDTPITYGLALDNMTGMEDVWNTTPAWTYPYLAASPEQGDGPAVNSLMGAGLGIYALLDNHWYAYFGDYIPMSNEKVMNLGTPDAMGNSHSNTPYLRLAWQGDIGSSSYLEIGGYGIVQKAYGMTLSDKSDKFTDGALDAQYEMNMDNGSQINAHAVYIHESQDVYNSGVGSSENINQTRADIAYINHNRTQYQLGYFKTTGSDNAKAFHVDEDTGMMGFDAFTGNSKGYVAEFDYLPKENTKLSLQYTDYKQHEGVVPHHDQVVGNLWVMW